MSGKQKKKPAKMADRAKQGPTRKRVKLIEFTRSPKGTLRPKTRWGWEQ